MITVRWTVIRCMDLLSGYYQFRKRDVDIKYTAFQTAGGSYEYLVIRLSNAPATFNDGIRRLLNDLTDFCLFHFDDIYIFTRGNDIQSHLDGLDTVLARLEENHFYVKLSKYVFYSAEIPCLGDCIGRNGIHIDPKKVVMLREWPLPKTKNEVQSFLGTATYVQRFCAGFANDAGPLFDMLKKDKLKSNKTIEWDQKQHFESLKQRISATPILAVADFRKPFYMRMDASEYAIGGVLFQLEEHDGKQCERPVAFQGRKYKGAEKNYSIREKELLAILYVLRVWRVYLLDKPFIVETDHKSLENVFTQKSISRRIARWYDELSGYPVTFKYIPGDTNTVADGISRRADFQDCVRLEEVITANMVSSRVKNGLSLVVTEASERYNQDPHTQAIIQALRGKRKKCEKQKIKFLLLYSLDDSKLFYTGPNDEAPRFVLPAIKELINAIIFELHDVECYGHPGMERTLRLVEQNYFWRHMARSVCLYVKSCEVCQRTKARNTKLPGILQSQPIPRGRWTNIAMDFIVGLPQTPSKHDSVLVVVDQLTKRAHFVARKSTESASNIAEIYRDCIFVLHGITAEILSDRDTKFTSTVWTTLCAMLGTRQKLTTAFRRQAYGVTEHLNQTIENYLRAFSNGASTDWDSYHAMAEFAFNSRFQQSISITSFEADFCYLPSTPATIMNPPQLSGVERQRQALGKTFLELQANCLATVRRELQKAADRMSKYYDANRPLQTFEVGEEVLLSTENLANYLAGKPKQKLGARWIGPYAIVNRFGHDYYEIKLPKGVKFHPVFHTSYLKPYVRSDDREQKTFKVLLPDSTKGKLVEGIVGCKR
ncbi:LOW QUALITY PROTEIN: Pol Polyprotein, partial [Phytophthora megakarya]